MNVTVHVAPALWRVMEGRRRLELGLPPGADAAELWDTLLALYPGLRACLPGDLDSHCRLLGLWGGQAERLPSQLCLVGRPAAGGVTLTP
jgi:hypothetical protein